MTTASNIDPRSAGHSLDEGARQLPPQQQQQRQYHLPHPSPPRQRPHHPSANSIHNTSHQPPNGVAHHHPPPPPSPSSHPPPYRSDDDDDDDTTFYLPSSHPNPHPSHPSHPSNKPANRPPQVNRYAGVRRMSSVPELGQTLRGISGTRAPSRSHSRERSSCNNYKVWDGRQVPPVAHGGNRLIRQKSIERGMIAGVPQRPSSGKRMISSGGGPRSGSRPGSRNDMHPHSHQMAQGRPIPPPGLKMPLAFNNIARERGFTTGSHLASQQQQLARNHAHGPHAVPTNGAPDHYENRQRPQHREPPRSHPYPPQPPFSANSSAYNSPHSSFGPFNNADEIRTSFRSALSVSDMNRSSGFTTASSETPTDDSHAMTVDEAIGMYGSDTDDDMYTSGMESEHRRSKGDSVLGGGRNSPHGSYSECSYRMKGDSVLGGETSPEARSRHSGQEEPLEEEIFRQAQGDSSGAPRADEVLRRKSLAPTIEDGPDVGAPPDLVEEMVLSSVPNENGETDEGVDTTSPDMPEQLPQDPIPAAIADPPAPPAEPRDRYGFKKQSQYVSLAEYLEWEVRYNETLDRRRKKWDQLLRESGLTPGEEGPVRFPPKSAKIKRYVRKGIPPEWRGAAWFWYAGGQKYLNKNAGLYDSLVKKGSIAPDAELIERDLHRTFPDNIKYKPDPPPGTRMSKMLEKQYETPMVQKLRRVLIAFAIHVPRIGYCQSLNFLAGLLLLFMPEEKAFWMLYIMTQMHLPGTHEMNLEGSSVDQWVLMTSVRESLPHIWQKIGGGLDGSEVELNGTGLPPVTLCTSSWFMSGFIGSLPIETILRVWDCLWYEGSKTLFRIALTVFKTGEAQIKAVSDPMEIFQVVQTIPRRLIDAGALIEACYRRRNGFGHLSQETIDERRQERRNVFAEERALIARGLRLSKDDGALRGGFDSGSTHKAAGGHGELGKKFKKILVKT